MTDVMRTVRAATSRVKGGDGRGREEGDRHDGLRAIVRAGWTAKGVVYLLLAWLVFQLATGDTSEQPSTQGAFGYLATTGPGTLALVLLGAGLVAYAVGRVLEVTVLARDEVDAKDRAVGVGLALVYAVLAISAFSIAASAGADGNGGGSSGGSRAGGGGESAQQGTAMILDLPGGRLLVGLVGAGFAALAAYAIVSGVAQRFLETLRTGEMSARARRWTEVVGSVAYVTRGAVFGLLAWFLVQAAVTHDPSDAKGLDGALREVAEEPWGEPLLLAVAAGLLMYGAYSVIEARYRRIGSGATGT